MNRINITLRKKHCKISSEIGARIPEFIIKRGSGSVIENVGNVLKTILW
jgi:hypothetical protein